MLGGFRIVRHGQPLPIAGHPMVGRLTALLAYPLGARHKRAELRDRLQALGEYAGSPKVITANGFRQTLFRLRRALDCDSDAGGGVLGQSGEDLWLEPSKISCDISEFETGIEASGGDLGPAQRARALQSVLRLYRGPFLAGWSDAAEWAAAAVHYEAMYRRGLREYISIAESHDSLGALECAVRLVRCRHREESDYVALMNLLTKLDRPGDAIEFFRDLERYCRLVEKRPGPAAQKSLRLAIERSRKPSSELPGDVGQQETAESLIDPGAAFRASRAPLGLTRIVGRDAEVSRLNSLIQFGSSGPRLITITGAGGVGKTRLACEVSRRIQLRPGVSVTYVSLVECFGAQVVAEQIRDSLGLPTSAEFPLEQVATHIGDRPALIVLDNADHLAPGLGRLLQFLLEKCVRVTCLVTSREVLDVYGEQRFALMPLDVPQAGMELDALRSTASVQLLEDRLRERDLGFTVTEENRRSICELCRRLGGVPLLLEIVASRFGELDIEEINLEVRADISRVCTRSRRFPARHQSLAALLESSLRSLDPPSRRLLGCLSYFRGGWTSDAARHVSRHPDIHAALADLEERSLIVADRGSRPCRHSLLEPVREWLQDSTVPSSQAETASAHAVWYDQWISDISDRADCLDLMQQEQANLFQAIRWGLQTTRCTPVPLIHRQQIWTFWTERGHLQGVQSWLEEDLLPTLGPDGAGKPLTLQTIGKICVIRNQLDRGLSYLEQTVRTLTDLNDWAGLARTLAYVGTAQVRLCRTEDALRTHYRYMHALEMAGEKSALAVAWASLAESRAFIGDLAGAREAADYALSLQGCLSNPSDEQAFARRLQFVEANLGEAVQSEARFEKLLQKARDDGSVVDEVNCLRDLGNFQREFLGTHRVANANLMAALNLAIRAGLRSATMLLLDDVLLLCYEVGDYDCVHILWAASTALREELGVARDPVAQRRYMALMRSASKSVSPTSNPGDGWRPSCKDLLAVVLERMGGEPL